MATPLLVEALGQQGLSHGDAIIRIGGIASLGVLAYGFGKFFLAGLGDVWGGRTSFLIGILGATAFTVIFASGLSLPIFSIVWIGNQLTQSLSWAGLLKVSSKWFDYSSYGIVIGTLSLSYLVGDAAARQWMGMLIEHGFGWQALFYLAAGTAGTLLLINALFLKESKVDAGFAEAKANPLNLFSNSEEPPKSLRELLLPLIRSHAFLLVCHGGTAPLDVDSAQFGRVAPAVGCHRNDRLLPARSVFVSRGRNCPGFRRQEDRRNDFWRDRWSRIFGRDRSEG